jgi:quercetin dioxygenase-like cupin family protein
MREREEALMKLQCASLIGAGLLGLCVAALPARSEEPHKAIMINHLFTGPDRQTHVEEIEAKFAGGGGNDVYKLLANSGAELRRAAPGRVSDWHTAPRRQYVITLSGHGELEVSGGKKISVGPGSIELVEDVTGKGHITRVVGNEERVTLAVPLSEQK